MATRTTRPMVERAFQAFCKAFGFRLAKSYNDVGAYCLDYNSTYGGYQIERIENSGGGVDTVFGGGRHSPAEMWEMLWFAVKAKEAKR